MHNKILNERGIKMTENPTNSPSSQNLLILLGLGCLSFFILLFIFGVILAQN